MPHLCSLKSLRYAVPVAVLCVLTALPAAAVPITAGGDASAIATSAAQPSKQALKAQRKAEQKALKACKKAMKAARKTGAKVTCGAAGAKPEAATVVTPPAAIAPLAAAQTEAPALPAAVVADLSNSITAAALPVTRTMPTPVSFSKVEADPVATAVLAAAAPVQEVPEPGTLALLGAGLAALAIWRRRKTVRA